MAAQAFQIEVRGALDGATRLVIPDPLPAPTDGVVTKIDAGVAVAVGEIDLGGLIGTTSPMWLRSIQVEYAASTRGARIRLDIPGQRDKELLKPDRGSANAIDTLSTLWPRVVIPQGALLEILTDDTDTSFGGAPVNGPHFIYFELEPLTTDEQIALATEVESVAKASLDASSQKATSHQVVAASLIEEVLLLESPDDLEDLGGGDGSQVMVCLRARVKVGTAPAAGESMVINVIVQTGAGPVVSFTVATFTIDDTTVLADNNIFEVPVSHDVLQTGNTSGSTVLIQRVYVAGGGPAMDDTIVDAVFVPAAYKQYPNP